MTYRCFPQPLGQMPRQYLILPLDHAMTYQIMTTSLRKPQLQDLINAGGFGPRPFLVFTMIFRVRNVFYFEVKRVLVRVVNCQVAG
jgi:hypothetical protein